MSADSATADSVDYYRIYLGAWTNWSHGKILGATITLTRRDGGLLISFIALFVTLTGTAFWRIACFAFHHYYSSEAPRDGLYHQRQAVLRNSANGASGLWTLGRVMLTWREKASRMYHRILPLVAFTVLCLLAFATAGVFSSKIATSTGTEVLVTSSVCGGFRSNNDENATHVLGQAFPYLTKRTASFSDYAQRCYGNISGSEDCHRYVQAQLPTKVSRTARCPFTTGMCHSEYGNLEIDTDFLDSNDHFGINAPPIDRFLYRRITRCAPLVTEGYSRQFKYSDNDSDVYYMRLYYGQNTPPVEGPDQFIYEYPYPSLQRYFDEQDTSSNSDYSIGASMMKVFNKTILSDRSIFIPIPELRNLDRDLSIYYLSANTIFFTDRVDDPIYAATDHKIELNITLVNESAHAYFADQPVSALACSMQDQFCNPNLPVDEQCAPLGGMFDAPWKSADLWSTERQRQMVSWFWHYVSSQWSMDDIVEQLGIGILQSRRGLYYGVQGPLPDNQWQFEVENWSAITLAAMQGWTVELATGPSDPSFLPWIGPPSNDAERYCCKNQKILTTAYTNFNAFGLCFTIVLGTIIIAVSYSVEPLVSWIQKRRRLDTYSRLEWCTNETLQLQRLAHEELGLGTWSGGAEDIPSTEPGERLAVLDLSRPDHPRLKAPPANLDDVLAAGTSGGEEKVPDHDAKNASDNSSNSEARSQQQTNDTQSPLSLPELQFSVERVALHNEGSDESVSPAVTDATALVSEPGQQRENWSGRGKFRPESTMSDMTALESPAGSDLPRQETRNISR